MSEVSPEYRLTDTVIGDRSRWIANTCLRCSRALPKGQRGYLVHGNDHAMYRDMSIIVCQTCGVSPMFDTLVGVVEVPHAHDRPQFFGAPLTGYAKVSQLANGVYRVGLHRGHVEVWTPREVQEFPLPVRVKMAYSLSYQMYGPVSVFQPGQCIPEETIEFVDLSRPEDHA